MNNKIATWVAGIIAVVVVSAALGFVLTLNDSQSPDSWFNTANLFLNALYYSAYGIVGALVLAGHPCNTVAWLLLVDG